MAAYEAVARAAEAIAACAGGTAPKTALVLGSGLGAFGAAMNAPTIIPYTEIPGFPVSTVAGHAGQLLVGDVAGLPLLCMQGRMHLYEGYDAGQIALPIRALRLLGVERLILTNAAGGIAPGMQAGDLMVIEDHINFSGRNPLIGANDERFGPRFPDMSTAYDPDLRARLMAAAQAEGVAVHAGVYLWILGPNFETPAEIRAFARLGADAVGMSTVPECLVAHHCGMKVAGLSLITNLAAGLSPDALSHAETLSVAEGAYGRVERLLLRFFAGLNC